MTGETGTNWVVIPVKNLSWAKSRLSEILNPAQRNRLVLNLLQHTLEVVQAGSGRPLVISPDQAVLSFAKAHKAATLAELPGGLTELEQPQGLNRALNTACHHLLATFPDRRSRVLILPADLPMLDPADIQSLLFDHLASPALLAPDLRGKGTNALRLSLAGAAGFNFCFGENSFMLHREALRQAGTTYEICRRPAVLYDLDYPSDFENLPAALRGKFLK